MTQFENITNAATLIPVGTAIFLTCRGFSGLGMGVELVAILTILMASVSWMLSQALPRFLALLDARAFYMAVTLGALGVSFLFAETLFAHQGLEWLMKQGDGIHAPGWILWACSAILSVVNVCAKWVFLSAPKPRAAKAEKTLFQQYPPELTDQDQFALKAVREGIAA